MDALAADHVFAQGPKAEDRSSSIKIKDMRGFRVGTKAYVKIETNPQTRESRLFSSIPQYLRRYGRNRTFVTESGGTVAYTQVNEAYIEDGDFIRLRLRARPHLFRIAMSTPKSALPCFSSTRNFASASSSACAAIARLLSPHWSKRPAIVRRTLMFPGKRFDSLSSVATAFA